MLPAFCILVGILLCLLGEALLSTFDDFFHYSTFNLQENCSHYSFRMENATRENHTAKNELFK